MQNKICVITGAGTKAFVARADISEFLQLDSTQGEELARKGQRLVFDKKKIPRNLLWPP
jgi:enoyl-CoA hydratase